MDSKGIVDQEGKWEDHVLQNVEESSRRMDFKKQLDNGVWK